MNASIIAKEIRKLAAQAGMPEEGELNYWAWEVEKLQDPSAVKPSCPVCGTALISIDGETCSTCGSLEKCDTCGVLCAEGALREGKWGSYCAGCAVTGKMVEHEADFDRVAARTPRDFDFGKMIADVLAPMRSVTP